MERAELGCLLTDIFLYGNLYKDLVPDDGDTYE